MHRWELWKKLVCWPWPEIVFVKTIIYKVKNELSYKTFKPSSESAMDEIIKAFFLIIKLQLDMWKWLFASCDRWVLGSTIHLFQTIKQSCQKKTRIGFVWSDDNGPVNQNYKKNFEHASSLLTLASVCDKNTQFNIHFLLFQLSQTSN